MVNNDMVKEQTITIAKIVVKQLLQEETSLKKLEGYKFDVSNLDEETRLVMASNAYATTPEFNFFINNDEMYELVKSVANEMVKQSYNNDFAKELKNRVYESSICHNIDILRDESGRNSFGRERFVVSNTEQDFDRNKTEEVLKEMRVRPTYRSEMLTPLESLTVIAPPHWRTGKMKESIDLSIKKLLKNEMTYCLKKGVLTVPEEYSNQGMDGLERWRKIQSSKNKNNSMEKRLIRENTKEVKERVYNIVCKTTRNVAFYDHEWNMPVITVDGVWNKTKNKRLATHIMKGKSIAEISNMSDEDITKMVKKYWVDKLEGCLFSLTGVKRQQEE